MGLKYRFNLKDIKIEDFKVYLFALFKGILPKKKIRNFLDLEEFIQNTPRHPSPSKRPFLKEDLSLKNLRPSPSFL